MVDHGPSQDEVGYLDGSDVGLSVVSPRDAASGLATGKRLGIGGVDVSSDHIEPMHGNLHSPLDETDFPVEANSPRVAAADQVSASNFFDILPEYRER